MEATYRRDLGIQWDLVRDSNWYSFQNSQSETFRYESPMASARGFVLKEHRRYALLLHKSAQAVVNLANPTDKVPCRWLPRPCVALAMSSEMIAIQDGIVRVESDL